MERPREPDPPLAQALVKGSARLKRQDAREIAHSEDREVLRRAAKRLGRREQAEPQCSPHLRAGGPQPSRGLLARQAGGIPLGRKVLARHAD